MVADVLPPLVPVPREQPGETADLDRVLVRFLFLALVALLVCALRVDIRDECDLRAVRRKDERRQHAHGEVRHSSNVLAVRVGDVQLCGPFARGDEGDPAPVGREPRRVLRSFTGNQLVRRAPVSGHTPDVGVAASRFQVRGRPQVNDRSAVGRELWIRDADGREQIVDSHRPAALRSNRTRREGRHEQRHRGQRGFHARHHAPTSGKAAVRWECPARESRRQSQSVRGRRKSPRPCAGDRDPGCAAPV